MGMAETGGGSSAAEIEPVGGGVLDYVYASPVAVGTVRLCCGLCGESGD